MSRSNKRSRRIGRNPVDDREPRVDAGAVAGIDAAIDGRGENKGRAIGEIGIKRIDLRARRIVRRCREHNEPPSLRQPAQRRTDMARGSIAHRAFDVG